MISIFCGLKRFGRKKLTVLLSNFIDINPTLALQPLYKLHITTNSRVLAAIFSNITVPYL